MTRNRSSRSTLPVALAVLLSISLAPAIGPAIWAADGGSQPATPAASIEKTFTNTVQPLLKKYCLRCHHADNMESGIRVDRLDGRLQGRTPFLWEEILAQVEAEAMPPEDQPQPTVQERRLLAQWIPRAINAARSRITEKNGSVRRLTVSQYRNTLRDLLGLAEDLTDVLPPDGVSKDGFANNGQTLLLSPLQVESYFDIAEKSLDLCLVDADAKPAIQNFRMDLGTAINPNPCPDKLILGANSLLLNNQDFLVTELSPAKPFKYRPIRMRTDYEFIEGYQGNATVRGWRKYDSIYHAVFACLRGTRGYPQGLPFEVVPTGLLLRPAIPSSELFGQSSTYGPMANFKVSLRELPKHGNFRITVVAARYDEGMLLDKGAAPQVEPTAGAVTIDPAAEPDTITIDQAGLYQADVYVAPAADSIAPDGSKLEEGLIGAWMFDGDTKSTSQATELDGQLRGEAALVDSPFGQALSVDGKAGHFVVTRSDALDVGDGAFSVAAWIRPRALRQAGIACLGGYGYTHGWLFDMPNGKGILRLETAKRGNLPGGTVQSPAGVIRVNRWQHVAAVVRRGENGARLYVNGYQVAAGTVEPVDLDNPNVALHIGRIQNANFFAGEIDQVRLYRRALEVAEIQALVAPGQRFARAPPEKEGELSLSLGDRRFTGPLVQPAFLAVRLPAGPLAVKAESQGMPALRRIVLTPLKETDDVAEQFHAMDRRAPRIGVHVGLRRDCGSTLAPVGPPQTVASTEFNEFVFEGAVNNFPSPDVEKDNVNYLAGIREIGVRSEYTDGREMPRLLLRSVEFEGPFYKAWPPATHRNILIESDHKDDPEAYARDVIRSFSARAFRRPATDAEVASLLAVWESAFSSTGDFQHSVKDALVVVLTSPQFLFLIENSSSPRPEDLDAYELASKLSYFLWDTAPDRHLLKLAAANRLHHSLDAEIDRMLRDPRCQQFVQQFTSQWLSLDKFDVVQVDQRRYPRMTRDTKTQLRNEPIQFVRHLLKHNLPLRNLVQSDFILVNEVVASYYDLGDRTQSGFQFVPIRHENENLGGILSQASILAGLSDGRESNPIKRGAWFARKIIAEPPDDPPPNVPQLPEDDGSKLTLRERLERHRNQKGCAKCHAGIDPWGIPFEKFDAGGRFKNADVDARSTLPDQTEIADLNELKAYLADDRIDQVAFSLLKHLASYAVGRSLTYNEIVFLQEEGLELGPGGYRLQDMIRFVIKSDLFLKK